MGLCQPRLPWPHLPVGTATASPRKELKSFSIPLQPAQGPASFVGCPGGSTALVSSEQRWLRPGWWLPGGTRGDAVGSACPADPRQNRVIAGLRFGTVSVKSDSVPDSEGKEGISFSYNGLGMVFLFQPSTVMIL